MNRRPFVLDSCSFLNLYASDRLAAIAAALGRPIVISDTVHKEALYVFRGGDGDDAGDIISVDCAPLIAQGVLSVVALASDELSTFVDLARSVDDGEAATVALALHRAYAVVTDDGKAINLLRTRAPHLPHHSTLAVLKAWMDHVALPSAEAQVVLKAICQRGHFEFPRRDPLRDWAPAVLGGPVQLPRRRC